MDFLSENDKARLDKVRAEVMQNLDQLEKKALTGEQLSRLNEARMNFLKANNANRDAKKALNYA